MIERSGGNPAQPSPYADPNELDKIPFILKNLCSCIRTLTLTANTRYAAATGRRDTTTVAGHDPLLSTSLPRRFTRIASPKLPAQI
eukprot:scaffold2280_cov430-Prasinococcus_capsulatus_cf.AAC.19